MKRRAWVVLTAAALVLAGCSSAEAEAGTPEIVWAECDPGLECATVPVPVEYSEPDGEQIQLSVIRHRATEPDQRIGTLFFNPGGPGVAASDAMRGLGKETAMFSPELQARFDIIGMDPRGVGDSEGVRCLTDEQRAEAAAADLDPALPGGKPLPQLIEDATTFTEGCAAHQSTAFLASLSTDNVARDIDHLRAALGEEQISFYGSSYGTVVGPTYATLFPDRVRQMVIDAPVDTELWRGNSLTFLDEVAVASEATLNAWFGTCREEGVKVCPFGDGDPEAAYDALSADLEAKPLKVPPTEGLSPGGILDGGVLQETVRATAGDRATWPTLTAGLLAAQQGDGRLLHFLWTSITVSPFGVPTAVHEAHTAVRCADWDTPTDIAEHEAAAAGLPEKAERIGTRAGFSALNCALWPAPNEDRYTEPLTAAGAPPTLVIGGRLDPATPYHWAESTAERLESAVLLTREGVGHVSYRLSGDCIDDAVDAAFLEQVLPEEGKVCTPEQPATTQPVG